MLQRNRDTISSVPSTHRDESFCLCVIRCKNKEIDFTIQGDDLRAIGGSSTSLSEAPCRVAINKNPRKPFIEPIDFVENIIKAIRTELITVNTILALNRHPICVINANLF